jgi:hypothetical protein
MKPERKLVTLKCPGCGDDFVSPLTIFRLPGELDLLAKCLDLPAKAVAAMLDTGTIPLRRAIDKNGRRHGKFLVFFGDAQRAIRGLRENMS